jgi:multiple sugar transport system permease protein
MSSAARGRPRSRDSVERAIFRVLRPLGIAFFVLVALFPFYYMVVLSMRDISEIAASPGTLLPALGDLSLDAYQRVLRPVDDGGEGFARFLLNSALLATATVVVTLLVSILGAYAVARLDFFGRRKVSLLFLSVYLFPPVLLAIPLFVAFSRLGPARPAAGPDHRLHGADAARLRLHAAQLLRDGAAIARGSRGARRARRGFRSSAG